MGAFDLPTREQIQEDETNRLKKLNRARAILGTYYMVLPFVLIYLLYKVFPPTPWPADTWKQMIFFVGKLNYWTTLDERLILLVIVAGALGSYIHAATSYSDYRGNRQFSPGWMLWYLLRPFVGVCLALIVYFALRGGLLSVILNGKEADDASKINPFGIATIAGLTGMFSKQAADKLAEVFTTLFKSQGDVARRDGLTTAPPPEIKNIDPEQGTAKGGTKVTITGARFVKEAKVSFGDKLANKVEVVNETTINVETPEGEGVVDVTVVNPDGQKVIKAKGYTYTSVAGEELDGAVEPGAVVDKDPTTSGPAVESGAAVDKDPTTSGP